MEPRGQKFSELEDLIREDQGEVGLVLERDEVTGEMHFTHMFNAENHTFTTKELQLAYVQMAMQETELDTEEKKMASSRLQTYFREVREEVETPTVVFQQEEKQSTAAPAGSSQDKKAKAKMKGVSTGTKYKKVHTLQHQSCLLLSHRSCHRVQAEPVDSSAPKVHEQL